jgi:hypothetical protein
MREQLTEIVERPTRNKNDQRLDELHNDIGRLTYILDILRDPPKKKQIQSQGYFVDIPGLPQQKRTDKEVPLPRQPEKPQYNPAQQERPYGWGWNG